MSPATRFANNKAAAAAAAKAKESYDMEEDEYTPDEDDEDEEEPEEVSKPLVEKPPQSPSASKITRKSSEK